MKTYKNTKYLSNLILIKIQFEKKGVFILTSGLYWNAFLLSKTLHAEEAHITNEVDIKDYILRILF